MAPMMGRPYDLMILGATGYTGKLTAEHAATHLPTDLKWAIAGRSESKLSALIDHLKSLNPDRVHPGLEIANLTPNELETVVKKTKVLINTVGPYHLYSSPVVEACAKNGTHYLDVTGESPWTLDMIRKYHSLAKANNAIMISQIGIESAPSDLVTYALATLIRETCDCGTGEVIGTTHEMKGQPSGGSLATVLTIRDSYNSAEINDANTGNWSSSPVPHPKPKSTASSSSLVRILSKGLGVRTIPELGVLTTSLAGGANAQIVQRSWGLLDEGKYYGPNFTYREYATARSRFVGVLVNVALVLGIIALALPPFRWAMKKIVTAPGQGAEKQAASKDTFEFRALAKADQDSPSAQKALGRLRYEGSMYYLTGIFLAEAAMVLLKEESLVKSLRGGYLTPAMLGQPYIDRLTNSGIVFDAQMLPE